MSEFCIKEMLTMQQALQERYKDKIMIYESTSLKRWQMF